MTAWNKEEAIEQIKHGGRFGHKRVMEKVYKHNCELFGLWADGLPTGVPGGLGDRAALLNGTKVYSKPFRCGVVTVAALSFREPNSYCNEERQFMAPDGGFTELGERIQLNKVRTIYRLALKNGHDSVILGAFGCGVNKLPCDAVARQFKSVLAEPEFAGKFKAACFAILEGRGNAGHPVGEAGKFAPFYAAFGKWTW
jgi:hypothetical protein